MTGYDFHPEVEHDLAVIWDFIAEDSPAAADKAIADILGAIETLAPFPHQGYRRTDLTGRPRGCDIHRPKPTTHTAAPP